MNKILQTSQNIYFIDLLQPTNSYEILPRQRSYS